MAKSRCSDGVSRGSWQDPKLSADEDAQMGCGFRLAEALGHTRDAWVAWSMMSTPGGGKLASDRTRLAIADGALVGPRHRHHAGGGIAEEGLVGGVEVVGL